MENIKTGITEEILTISSNTRTIDIFNKIIEKKSKATFNWIKKIKTKKEDKIIIIGTYFTGVGIGKLLKKDYENITIVDIYPHLEKLIKTELGGKMQDINFTSNLEEIKTGDIIIDTTGFGGLDVEFTKKLKTKAFLIEDPIAEENDESLSDKNNIHERINACESTHKAILKTKGLNTKTSGTMSITIDLLTKSINQSLEKEGVLYSACEMRFYEDIIFKEKNIEKFIEIAKKPTMKISTIKKYSPDKILEENIGKIHSEVIEWK